MNLFLYSRLLDYLRCLGANDSSTDIQQLFVPYHFYQDPIIFQNPNNISEETAIITSLILFDMMECNLGKMHDHEYTAGDMFHGSIT